MRSIAVWLVIIVVESIHGTLRELFLAPRIGDLPARRVAVFTGIVLIFAVALLTTRWMGVRGTARQLGVGALWVVLTVAFELALGRRVLGYDWPRILGDYDLSRGGLMGVGLLAMLLAPLLAARVRSRRAAGAA